jgi:uncharacterized protein YggE
MLKLVLAAAAVLAVPAVAQTTAEARHTIDVSGHGKVSAPPDTADIHYWIRGEGKTPDDATRAMVDSKARVENGLKGFLGRDAQITNSDLVVIEVRDPNCKTQPGQATLSEGQCAILGYLASSETDVSTPMVSKAGTAVGLASRLGARDARLQSFELRDTVEARRSAMTRAVADAREQAQVLAAAAGGHLGPVLTIQYGSYGAPVVISGSRIYQNVPPAPPPPPPPVEVDMKPRPQEITADVSVRYELIL